MRSLGVLIVGGFLALFPIAQAESVIDTLETQGAVRALDDLRLAWLGQLDDLIATARALAVADDTYEFTKRPNIPYIHAHYDPEHLAAYRIDTVLIVNLQGTPLFWRRLNQGVNRGFSDARLFLAELPPLATSGVTGVPRLAGAATLAHGPKILVAMPICAPDGSGVSRGWLIVTRPLDADQWRRYTELAHIPVQLLDPAAAKSHGIDGAALQEALTPFVRLEAKQIRGFMTVPDLQGRPFRVFSVSMERQDVRGASIVPPLLTGSAPWVCLMVVMSSLAVAGGATGIRRLRNAQLPTSAARSPAHERPVARVSTGVVQVRNSLQDHLAIKNASFRFQPQIDLQTGRVAGVEALLCVPELGKYRPAMELAHEIEAAGLGLALVEHHLRSACREQRGWLQTIGHEFPIGVPVSQRALLNTAFLPLVQRILMEYELTPSFLELELEEASFGPSAAALRSITQVRETGISIAIDSFNAANSNLRWLSILPISKLRLDPWLLLRTGDGRSEALLFDGILGAARGLDIAVCATGIASEELLSMVLRHGRPLAQGEALGAPMSSEEFVELLRRNNVDTVVVRPLDS
jgi:EAL domain-containing protein (putative c-di-GMP-specific phosphodiesterase class I)/sensor domain CHASE-containing protein